MIGMAGPSERARHEQTARDAQRRSKELEQERLRLQSRLLETAESVRRSHERTAETMETLAEFGPAEHATRRRRAAEWSRRLAAEEAFQIAKLRGGGHCVGTDDRSDADPS